MFKRTQRSATFSAIMIIPVPGPGTFQGNDARAGLAGCCPLDVGKPPLIALLPAIGEGLRHPGRCILPQPRHDRIEIEEERRC